MCALKSDTFSDKRALIFVCFCRAYERLVGIASFRLELDKRCRHAVIISCSLPVMPVGTADCVACLSLQRCWVYCSLDSVSAFRAQVRRHASKNIFEQLRTQELHQRPLPSKGSEFPQHLIPEKRRRRSRHQRHKTLPVTAEELNAIPEGEQLEPVPFRETHEMWKRDSRTDSGILSGSDVESLGSDSLRSLSLEMDVSDSDPSRLSVFSKTSMFRSLDERARVEREKEKSASGAKRYIDRKKRERSRTQPVTDDEVKTAAEMSDEKKPPAVKLPQPEVVNRPKSPSVDQEAEQEEDDQLTK